MLQFELQMIKISNPFTESYSRQVVTFSYFLWVCFR